MPITKEQAIELADKYLQYTGKVALRDNIVVISKNSRGWMITAKTTPIILGMDTEVSTFSVDAETGEIGASITAPVSINYVLKQIDERKDLDETKKEQVKEKVREVEEEATKKPTDKKKISSLKKWFEDNAPYLKSVIDLITAILSKLP